MTYIFAVDFDGTITEANSFPRVGKLRRGIRELLIRIKAGDHDLILSTCRHGDYLTDAIKLINGAGFGFVFSGFNTQSRFAPAGLSGKIYSHFTLDDAAIPGKFSVKAWTEYLEKLHILGPIEPKHGPHTQNRRR